MSSSELAHSPCLPPVVWSVRSPERILIKLNVGVEDTFEGFELCGEYFVTTVLGSSDGRERIVALVQLDTVSVRELQLLAENYDVRLDSLKVIPTIEMVPEIDGAQRAILRISPEEHEKAPCLPNPNDKTKVTWQR